VEKTARGKLRDLRLRASKKKDKIRNKRIPMNILIAEDNITVNSVITEIIRSWGHRVEHADTCKDALAMVREHRFDLILLDIFLPDGKGHKLIPQLKELRPELGIITMTGYNTRELETEVRKQGILYYMTKPFDTKCLKELLDHISHKYDQKEDNEIPIQGRGQVIVQERYTLL
jgi:DNA-binding NtrC family response regulator